MKRGIGAEISSSLLILLFGYTAISKAMEYSSFRKVLKASPLIAHGAGTIAWLLPATEIVVVLLLLFPKTRLRGLYCSLALLTMFTGYLLYMTLFAGRLPCNCGGVISKMSWQQHIFFNLFFVGVTITGIIFQKKMSRARAGIQNR